MDSSGSSDGQKSGFEAVVPEERFLIDAKSMAEIAQLKDTFQVTSATEVIRRALALAKVASDNARPDKTLAIISESDGPETVKRINLAK